MARTARDIEAYLSALGKTWEPLEGGTYVINSGEDAPPIALRLTDAVLVVRVKIGEAPHDDPKIEAPLFRRLLQLNASEFVYCSYGLESGDIVLTAALELQNLDLNELEAALADIDLALFRHISELRQLCKGA
jgi:hypothetical protein